MKAPISGTVIQRQVGLGQYIQAGSTNPLFSIGDLSTLWVLGNVRESDAPRMRVGEAADIRVVALPDRVFTARLNWIAPAIDPATHRLAVRAELENPRGTLKPLMFATVAIHTSSDQTAPAIPQSAVIYEGDQTHVWVAYDNHELALRNIRVGRIRNNDIEILAGLRTGETVVTGGALFIDRASRPD
jgi:cobalt-zinc-cadmium efflux system membrane fusion protein